MRDYKRSKPKREVDDEIFEKGKDIEKDFDASQRIVISFSKTETKLISIRLPKWQLNQLREVAQRKGDIGYQQLIKIYVAEGLLKEKKVVTVTGPLGNSTGIVSNRLGRWQKDGPEDASLDSTNILLSLR